MTGSQLRDSAFNNVYVVETGVASESVADRGLRNEIRRGGVVGHSLAWHDARAVGATADSGSTDQCSNLEEATAAPWT